MANILTVDDDLGILTSTVRALRSAGHEVTQANGGIEAIELLRKNQKFDVAITDYEMPGADGLELLRTLRESNPACIRILMSGRLALPVVIDAVNRGEVSRVLEKPFKIDVLLSAVDEALGSRKQLEQLYASGKDEVLRFERDMLIECMSGTHLKLAVQPIIDVASGNIVAYEALMRSSHEKLNGPLVVLAAAERHEMILDLASVVVARAAEWVPKLPANTKLFVNMHPLELSDPAGLEKRLAPISPFASRVVCEITERSSLMDGNAWEQSIAFLTKAGYSIAVDDLGSGYNSLAVLAELQPHYIKVDMSIIRNIDTSPRKRRLVELLCRFAETTGAILLAEGVETKAEFEAVRSCGTKMVQGYYIGKPSLILEAPKPRA